jgi:hypothetical protein
MPPHDDDIRVRLSGFVDDLPVGFADGDNCFRFDFVRPQHVDQLIQLALLRLSYFFGRLCTSGGAGVARSIQSHNMQQGNRSAILPSKRSRALQRPRHRFREIDRGQNPLQSHL